MNHWLLVKEAGSCKSLFIQSANTSNTSAWITEKTKNHQYHKEGTIVAVINVDTSWTLSSNSELAQS